MKTILLVDDSPTILLSLKALLDVASFSCVTAKSAADALVELSRVKVDATITDLNMPGMNGIELVREIRKLPGGRFMPILLLTTESQAERRLEAKQAGATGWLVKPVAGPDLVSTLKRLLPGA